MKKHGKLQFRVPINAPVTGRKSYLLAIILYFSEKIEKFNGIYSINCNKMCHMSLILECKNG